MRKYEKYTLIGLMTALCLGGTANISIAAQNEMIAENTRNQDEIGEKEILVVSFGSSDQEARMQGIAGIEQALEDAFPDWSVRRAFTSQTVIDRIEERDGLLIDSMENALERAEENGVKQLIVQPTHLSAGYEYEELQELLGEYASDFEQLILGMPLLNDEADYAEVASILSKEAAVRKEEEITCGDVQAEQVAVVYFAHASGASAGRVYAHLSQAVADEKEADIYLGTDASSPAFEDVAKAVKTQGYTHVILQPITVVAGEYAKVDMAGEDNKESWYCQLTDQGYEVRCVLKGIGEIEEIRDLYIAHTQMAVDVCS